MPHPLPLASFLLAAALAGCASAPPAPPRPPPPAPLQAGPEPPASTVPPAETDATQARQAEQRGDPAAAEAAFARRLAVADDPEARLGRALALERLGRDAEAIVELERLRDADPSRAALRARLAERYEAVGRLEEAEAELRALADATAARPEGWRRLAAFCSRHGLADHPSCALARARTSGPPARRELRPLLPNGR